MARFAGERGGMHAQGLYFYFRLYVERSTYTMVLSTCIVSVQLLSMARTSLSLASRHIEKIIILIIIIIIIIIVINRRDARL